MQDKPYRKINFAYPATPLNSAYSSVIDFIKPSVRDAPAPIITKLSIRGYTLLPKSNVVSRANRRINAIKPFRIKV